MEQHLMEALEQEKRKTRGVFDTMQSLSLSLYCLTIAKWTNPILYDTAWRILKLSTTSEQDYSGHQERELSQEANSEWTEDPTENEQ